MILNDTVFLLGAGGSWHYGYPTGEELVKKVVERAAQAAGYFHKCRTMGSQVPRYVNDKRKGQAPLQAAWIEAATDCDEMAKRLKHANPLVIDYFLGQSSAQLQAVGKLLIALVILECEAAHADEAGNVNRRDALRNSPSGADRRAAAEVDIKLFKDDWYRFVLDKLVSRCADSKSLLENKATFVTFNYDVSLERSLYQGLHSIQLFQREHIDAFLSNGRVLHIYGNVRDCPPPDLPAQKALIQFHLDQSAPANSGDIKRLELWQEVMDVAYEASARIKVISPGDKRENEPTIKAAKEAFQKARCVYILGFGFDEENVDLLGIDKTLRLDVERGGGKRAVMLTNFGDRNQINRRASRALLGDNSSLLPDRPQIQGHLKRDYIEKSIRDVYSAFEMDFDAVETRIL